MKRDAGKCRPSQCTSAVTMKSQKDFFVVVDDHPTASEKENSFSMFRWRMEERLEGGEREIENVGAFLCAG